MAFISFENIKEKHQTFDQTCNYALYALKYVWKRKQGKTYILTKELSALLNGLFPLVNMIIPGLIINELVQGRAISKLIIITWLVVYLL